MSLTEPSPANTVVVTGASSGIGEQIARCLASKGHGVTLVARRTDRLEELCGELASSHGIEAEVISSDLGDPAQRAALADRLLGGKPLSGLVNNAGFGAIGELRDNDQDRERQMVEVNVAAVHDLTVRLVPGMVERGSGAILNTASTAAFQPVPGFATYAATKAFVLSFSEALSCELGGTGVSCTALCPGPVKTEFAEVAGSAGMEDRLPSVAVVSAEEVARQAVRGMEKGQRVVIPGVVNRIQTIGANLAPNGLVLPVARRMMAD